MYASGMQISRALLPLFLLSASLGAHASKKKPLVVPPDVLTRVRTARHIFVSNGGEDDWLTYARFSVGSGYRALYQALAGWPGVQLVGSPAQADLIFQVSDNMDGNTDSDPFNVHVYLTVLDPKTQQVLWTNNGTQSLGYGMNAYKYSIKEALAPIEPTQPAPPLVKKPVLLPAQLKNPKKLFIQLSPVPGLTGVTEAGEAFSQALVKSGNYTMVDTASQADLVLSVFVDDETPPKSNAQHLLYMRVLVLDTSSKTILWSFDNRFIWASKITVEQQISRTMPYVMKSWNGVIGKDSM
jgi:hypothetical protein